VTGNSSYYTSSSPQYSSSLRYIPTFPPPLLQVVPSTHVDNTVHDNSVIYLYIHNIPVSYYVTTIQSHLPHYFFMLTNAPFCVFASSDDGGPLHSYCARASLSEKRYKRLHSEAFSTHASSTEIVPIPIIRSIFRVSSRNPHKPATTLHDILNRPCAVHQEAGLFSTIKPGQWQIYCQCWVTWIPSSAWVISLTTAGIWAERTWPRVLTFESSSSSCCTSQSVAETQITDRVDGFVAECDLYFQWCAWRTD